MKSRFAWVFVLFFLMVAPVIADQPRRPSACLQAASCEIKKGESTVLSWNTTCATAVTVGVDKRFYTHRTWLLFKYPNWEKLNPAFPHCGSMCVAPKVTTTYYLIARRRDVDFNKNGKADGVRRAIRRSVTIKVVD